MLGREEQLPEVVGLTPDGGQATRLSPLPLRAYPKT